MKTSKSVRIAATILALIISVAVFSGCSRKVDTEEKKLFGELKYTTIDEYFEKSEFRFPETDDEFYYRVYNDCAMISKCLSDKQELTIPSAYRGVPVVGICDGAFSNIETLVKITLGSNQLWIGNRAFEKCINLTTVIMSGTINKIGESAFSYCSSLRSIIIPSGIQKISSNSFSNCKNLRKVIIEPYTEDQIEEYKDEKGNVSKSISSGAFSYCKNLSAIWLPSEVSVIASNTFAGDVRPVVYGAEKSQAARFAADNILNFVMTTRNGFDAAARLYKPLTNYNATGVGQSVRCGQFDVTLDEVNYYEKLGNASAGDNQTLIALTFTIINKDMSLKYFEGLDVVCNSVCRDAEGEVKEYQKCPIMISPDLLGIGYPIGPVSGGTVIQGIIVLRVNSKFEAVTVLFPEAPSEFVVVGGK